MYDSQRKTLYRVVGASGGVRELTAEEIEAGVKAGHISDSDRISIAGGPQKSYWQFERFRPLRPTEVPVAKTDAQASSASAASSNSSAGRKWSPPPVAPASEPTSRARHATPRDSSSVGGRRSSSSAAAKLRQKREHQRRARAVDEASGLISLATASFAERFNDKSGLHLLRDGSGLHTLNATHTTTVGGGQSGLHAVDEVSGLYKVKARPGTHSKEGSGLYALGERTSGREHSGHADTPLDVASVGGQAPESSGDADSIFATYDASKGDAPGPEGFSAAFTSMSFSAQMEELSKRTPEAVLGVKVQSRETLVLRAFQARLSQVEAFCPPNSNQREVYVRVLRLAVDAMLSPVVSRRVVEWEAESGARLTLGQIRQRMGASDTEPASEAKVDYTQVQVAGLDEGEAQRQLRSAIGPSVVSPTPTDPAAAAATDEHRIRKLELVIALLGILVFALLLKALLG